MKEDTKRVLFVIHSLNVGGVEKAFLGIVRQFIQNDWEIHLALLENKGGFFEFLPKEVNVHIITEFQKVKPIIHEPLKRIVFNSLHQFRLIKALRYLYLWFNQKFQKSNLSVFRYIFKTIKPFNEELFDLAVAFAGPYPFIDYYVANKVNAKEKWGWVHFDISKFIIDEPVIREVYQYFSKINIVSQEAKDIFDNKFPSFIDKTCYTPNIIDIEFIKSISKEKIDLSRDNKQIVICTVGRISLEKGQHMALQALSIVVSKYPSVVWWFVGDGNDLSRCKSFVQNNGLSDNVVFTGTQKNPYPYMKNCDIYVQPSLHEGYCITLAEAKIFEHPIITTDFTGAKEQLSTYPIKYKVVKYDSSILAEALLQMIHSELS